MNSVQDWMVTARRARLKQELREEILAAASELFVEQGYAAVSMRAIADRVGCAPGTLYLYFKDKDSILAAICIETFSKLDKHMEAIANDASDPLERLRRAGRLYVQFGLSHPDHYFLTFAIAGQSPLDTAAMLQAGLHSFDCLRSVVSACIQAKQLRITDAEQVSQSFWAAMHGVVMLLISKPDFPFIEHNRLIDSVVEMAIEGIRRH
jgi:AcrR family transcriptional regulator